MQNSLWASFGQSPTLDYLGVGDFDGDGKSDVVGVTDIGQVWVGISSGSSFSTTLWAQWQDRSYEDFMVGDLDGDGRDDLIARDKSGIEVAYSDGATFSTISTSALSTSTRWFNAMTGDVNGDGRFDIVARDADGYWNVLYGSANRSLGTASRLGRWSPIVWLDVKLGDVNGDGKDDIIGRTTYGQWWVGLSTGDSIANQLWGHWSPAVLWFDVQLADLHGTGMRSIVGRTEGGQWWTAASTGSGFINQLWGVWDWSRTWRDLKVIDFDGDGKSDLIGRTSGQWWLAKSTGASFASSYVGHWAEVPWFSVEGTDPTNPSAQAMLPTSGFQPGAVTREFMKLLIEKANLQIAELENIRSKASDVVNVNTMLTASTQLRDSLQSYLNDITAVMNGQVFSVQFGSPEDVISPDSLRTTDRMILSFEKHLSSSAAASGEGEDPSDVDLQRAQKIGTDTYTELNTGFTDGIKAPIAGLAAMVSTVKTRFGAIVLSVGAGITAAANQGLEIVRRGTAGPGDFDERRSSPSGARARKLVRFDSVANPMARERAKHQQTEINGEFRDNTLERDGWQQSRHYMGSD